MTKTLPMMRSNFRTGPARWTLALTQFLLILDAAVLNVAVPHIGASFAMAPATQSWLINAFVVPFAGLLLVSGVIADRFGRRRTLVVGLSLLLVGAVAGALAASSTMVLASRVVQGAGGALAGAAAMSLVLHLFSGADRARVLALFATMGGAGGVAGTIIGGTVTEASGWRTLFWLAAVAAALGAVSALRWIPVDTEMTRRRVVWSGPLLMTTALACAAFSLTSAGTYTLVSRTVWVPAAISIVATLGFVLSEARSSSPVIPKTVWRNSRLISALFLAACAQFALTPTFLLVSVYPQEHMAYTATAAGLVLLPMSIVIVLFAPTLPRLLARSNLHVLLLVAFAAISIGGGLLALLISPSAGTSPRF